MKTTTADRILKMMKALDVDQTMFGIMAGASKSVVNQWISGDIKSVSAKYAFQLQGQTGYSARWIQLGEGSERLGQPTSPGDDRLPIRRVLFKLSAGVSGYEIEYENGESEPIFMGKRWFEQRHYTPEKLLAVKVSGRSMEPNLHEGDLVVINTEDVTLKDGEVFAANYDGELVIKRLKREAGQWYLSSDNQDKTRFSDKICSDGCGLIGRIVYRQTENI